MRTAAKRLGGHHPCWLSRKKKWRTLGLRPRKSGKTYMFHEDDIAAAITRLPAAGARGGRRRKIIGVIHAQG